MSASIISIWCERQTASFTKAFKKRYVTFDQESRKLTYAEDDRKQPKDVITLTKVVRCCQVMEVKSAELLTLMIDGNHEDGREDQWTLRMPNRNAFEQWNELLWTACASSGLMEPFNYGLPPVDPRTNLPFIQVPLEYLFKFAVLEKAVIHFFSRVTLVLSTNVKEAHPSEYVLVVGDKAVYIFKQNADIVCCSLLNHIRKIHHGPEATFFAIQIRSPAPDIVVKDFSDGVQLASVLSRLFQVAIGKKLSVMPINVPTAEVLVESQQLRLTPGEGYKMNVVYPSSKMRLRQAIDASRDETNDNGTEAQSDFAGGGEHNTNSGSISHGTGNANGANKTSDPLTKLLQSIGLPQYASTLLSQHVDLDVLQCMDASDLITFGVTDESHCRKILDAVLNSDMAELSVGADVGGAPVSTKAAPVAAAAAVGGGGGGITLDDEDDLDIPAAPPKPLLLDDDSDDDLLAPKPPAPAAPGKVPILFDDDL